MRKRRDMTNGLFGCIALGLFLFAADPTQAQTTANGPYYATPSWDQTLPAATRFVILSNFKSEAVLDRETGLVWERSPHFQSAPWTDAKRTCIERTVGSRKGWQLPSIPELASLLDPSAPSFPFNLLALPSGHPFINVQPSLYWSATTNAENSSAAWAVDFMSGFMGPDGKKSESLWVWCVRGGMNTEAH